MASTKTVLLIGGGLGAAGLAYYKLVYQPQKAREIVQRFQTQNSPSALAQLGKAGCQAYAAAYGAPPQATDQLCAAASQVAGQLLQNAPSLVSSLGKGVGSGVAAVGSGIGSGVKAIGSGYASGIMAIGKAPFSVANYGVKTAVSAVKTLATAPVSIGKSVVKSLKFW